MRRLSRAIALATVTLAAVPAASAQSSPDPADWPAILEAAEGQTVYWHSWGGATDINDYIAWVGDEVSARYGVTLNHVKLSDTAEAVSTVIAEKAAGRTEGGAVDLIWINGENFASMKRQDLLIADNWAEKLPNYPLADTANKPTLIYDFTVPVDGQESPWGTAQLTFYYDSAVLDTPPTSLEALADWVKVNPGRFTYAAPPNFIGTTFLKQVLYGVIEDPALLAGPVGDADFEAVTAPLWAYLEDINPHLWRSGRAYAADTSELKNLLADGEIDIAMTFNPGEASAAIRADELPGTVRSFVLDYGSMGNAHFVTIPFNANAKAGAMVVANFLLSPEAQAKKADETVWGDPTVLNLDALDPEDRALFDALDRGPATLSPDEFGETLREPDTSWTEPLEAEWMRRFGAGG